MSAMTVDEFRALSNAPKKAKGKKRDNPEERLHLEVVALLRKAGLLIYHGANEGDLPVQYRVKLKKKGTSPGFPDIAIFEPPFKGWGVDSHYHALFIELKNGKEGRVSPAQDGWLKDLRNRGYRAEVCRSMDEVMAVLRECYPNKFKP